MQDSNRASDFPCEHSEAWGGDLSEISWFLNARSIWELSTCRHICLCWWQFCCHILNSTKVIFYGQGVGISRAWQDPPGPGQDFVLICRRWWRLFVGMGQRPPMGFLPAETGLKFMCAGIFPLSFSLKAFGNQGQELEAGWFYPCSAWWLSAVLAVSVIN